MPTYTFKTATGQTVSRRLTIAQFEQIREGLLELQDDDGTAMALVFNPGAPMMIMRDGPSGGWASKAMKENKYRKAHNGVISQRQRDHVKKTKLIPNLGGREAVTWRDVQDEVHTKKGAAAAATFNQLVAQETKGS